MGERRVPAVRAPDGSLIYLVEADPPGRTIYDDDFDLVPDQPPPSGAASFDHVAQALPVGRMDNFVLFWRAVFGFVPERLWEIATPYGLVRSRSTVNPERSVRWPSNISESRETATGRFVSSCPGAGVHHV